MNSIDLRRSERNDFHEPFDTVTSLRKHQMERSVQLNRFVFLSKCYSSRSPWWSEDIVEMSSMTSKILLQWTMKFNANLHSKLYLFLRSDFRSSFLSMRIEETFESFGQRNRSLTWRIRRWTYTVEQWIDMMIALLMISTIEIRCIDRSFIVTRFDGIRIGITELSKWSSSIDWSTLPRSPYRIWSSLAWLDNCQYAVIPDRVPKKIQWRCFSWANAWNCRCASGSSGLASSRSDVRPVLVQFSNLLMIYSSSIIISINCLLALYGPRRNASLSIEPDANKPW